MKDIEINGRTYQVSQSTTFSHIFHIQVILKNGKKMYKYGSKSFSIDNLLNRFPELKGFVNA